MSEGTGRSKDDKSWKKLYQAALLELDAYLLPQRIAEAQKAIRERIVELRSNDHTGPEKEALEDAWFALNGLKRTCTNCHSNLTHDLSGKGAGAM